jgi:hypothetical protein
MHNLYSIEWGGKWSWVVSDYGFVGRDRFHGTPDWRTHEKSTKASQKPDVILSDSADCSELWSQLL